MALPILSPVNLSVPLSTNDGGTGLDLSSQSSPENKLLAVNSAGNGYELVTSSGTGGGGFTTQTIDLASDTYRKLTEVDGLSVNITADSFSNAPQFTYTIAPEDMPTDTTYFTSYRAALVLRGSSVGDGIITLNAYLNGTLLTLDGDYTSETISESTNHISCLTNIGVEAGDIIGVEIYGDSLDFTIESMSLVILPRESSSELHGQLLYGRQHLLFSGADPDELNGTIEFGFYSRIGQIYSANYYAPDDRLSLGDSPLILDMSYTSESIGEEDTSNPIYEIRNNMGIDNLVMHRYLNVWSFGG